MSSTRIVVKTDFDEHSQVIKPNVKLSCFFGFEFPKDFLLYFLTHSYFPWIEPSLSLFLSPRPHRFSVLMSTPGSHLVVPIDTQ